MLDTDNDNNNKQRRVLCLGNQLADGSNTHDRKDDGAL